ncbi:AAA domain-containing protein [Helicobacter trogontum]|uniref:AAA domain-containing protein n=1 Tax=Helicobacter trogontum TaxID=50960 RepID=UPI002A91DCE0|nr:AAA domain-containing protein [Helicobacter trogontum]MDY5185733.1 AAA domain-containing protein [Helicobacter trogontum]
MYNNDFLQAYPIVFGTTHSIVSSLNMNNALFDYIIIDESSQVDILTGVLALSIAKNAVIVGDKKQLSCIIDANIIKKVETLNKEFGIEEAYNYLTHSLLDSITEVLSEVPRVLLKEHYRCHPKIIGFCNKQFYNNELLIFSEENNRKDIIKVILASEGNHARGHYSLREIEIITEEIIPTLHQKASSKDIGIITPYREQKEKLEEYLGQDNDIQVDTVHKYQGREKECIIISLVDNQLSSFVDDPKMLNVSITRAKNFLYLVANKKILNTQGNVADFIRYIQYNNFEITQSNINSIFDLLYKANEEARESYLKNKKKISSYDSENLVYHAILEVLTDYPNLKVATHVRLGLLIKDTSSLNEQEQSYLNSALTHVDFVIYHAMNKEFLLAIEVDGYTFHNKDHKQYQRDIIKNNIFEKCKKTLLRLHTIGSNEKEQIRNELDKQ